jgi:hypothetical protein
VEYAETEVTLTNSIDETGGEPAADTVTDLDAGQTLLA